MELEEKIRRRLAPFIVEGKIANPNFSPNADAANQELTVNVTLKNAVKRGDTLELALFQAMHDLGSQAQLIITHA